MIVMLIVTHVRVMSPMLRTEDSFMELALSYFYMGSTQGVKLAECAG